ncbi:MAG: cell division protein ZapA [Rikenellaceae bacterium]
MASDNRLSITVRVGDKIYPMKINREDEKQIRDAADKLNEMYARFGSKIEHSLDRMALVALEMTRQAAIATGKEQIERAIEQIDGICRDIDLSYADSDEGI